jgi:monomeric isocitrate dehydrogenase
MTEKEQLQKRVQELEREVEFYTKKYNELAQPLESSTMQTIIYNAATGTQFMDIMQDYMECQESPTFNVQQGLSDLYEDLSNLYNDNIQ